VTFENNKRNHYDLVLSTSRFFVFHLVFLYSYKIAWGSGVWHFRF
jgi:hypothetical protein